MKERYKPKEPLLDRNQILRLERGEVIKYEEDSEIKYLIVHRIDLDHEVVYGKKITKSLLYSSDVFSIDDLVRKGIDIAKWRKQF